MRAKIAIMSGAALAAIALVLAGCASSPGGEVAFPSGDELDGSWQLTAGTDTSGTFDLGDTAITLDIAQTTASGKAPCNSYTGDFRATVDGVDFGPFASTMMACPPDSVMKLETRYLKALETVDTASIDGDTLTLSLNDDVLQLVYSEFTPPAASDLVGPTWKLETITTADTASTVQGDASLTFGEDGTFTGSAGCRGFNGYYVSKGADISFTSLEIDHSNCGAEFGDQETTVFDVLGQGFTAAIAGDTLTATRSGSDSALVYRAEAPQ